MSTKTYRVVVTRENDAWLADATDVPGTHTWAKNLPGLDHAIREAIAMAEDLPEGAEPDLSLDYEYRTGDASVDALTSEMRTERAELHAAEQRLAKRTRDAAVHLTRRGMSVRDVAVLLQVSAQRISQVAPRTSGAKQKQATTEDTVPKRKPQKKQGRKVA
ncbi:MAG: hypothetical protein WCA46_10260 [Actinocatenispora sp.]